MADVTKRQFTSLVGLVVFLFVVVLAEGVAIVRLWSHREGGLCAEKKHSLWSRNATKSSGDSVARRLSPHRDTDRDDLFGLGPDLDDIGNPFEEFRRIEERIERMFGEAFGRFRHSREFGHFFNELVFAPNIDLEDLGDHYLVTVDLPGVENTRVDVKLEGQTLTISGEIESKTSGKNKGRVLREERKSGKFYRSITLPSAVDGAKMTTTSKDGVLYVKIPKLVS